MHEVVIASNARLGFLPCRRRQKFAFQPHMAPAGESRGGEGEAFADGEAVVGVAEHSQREKDKA